MNTLSRLLGVAAAGLLATAAPSCEQSNPTQGSGDLALGTPDLAQGTPDLAQSSVDLATPADLTPAASITLTAASPMYVPNNAPTQVGLTGTGFAQGATVTVADAAATGVLFTAATDLKATVPAKAGACGFVPVEVMNTDGGKASRSDILSYYTTQPGFKALTLTTPALPDSPESIAVADFNGDKKPDLVFALGNGTAGVLLSNNQNNFDAVKSVTVGTTPRSVAAGDFDGDKNADFVVANLANGTLSVRVGDGKGAFTSKADIKLPDTKAAPRYVAVRDLSGDGKLDFLAVDEFNEKVAVALGDGLGGSASIKSYVAGILNPQSLVVGDFDGDSKLDVVVVGGNNTSEIGFLKGDGAGGLLAGVKTTLGGLNGRGSAIADFDGDKKLDLVVTNLNDDQAVLVKGSGTGTFTKVATIKVGNAPRGVIVGDFDCDGKPDFAVANSAVAGTGNSVSVMLNKGSFTFVETQVKLAIVTGPNDLALADIDGDGRPDIAIAQTVGKSAGVQLNDAK